jgi:nitroreductase
MKDNYEAWTVDYKEFYKLTDTNDKLKFLLRFALLAPSSHNSQPWRFNVVGNQIVIYPEESRELRKSDKNNRQLYLSLGAALQNVVIAGKFYGYKTDIKYLPVEFAGSAALISLDKSNATVGGDEGLIKAITTRHSNRNKYSNKRLSDRFINSLKDLNTADIKVYVISDKKLKDKIAEVVIDATIEAMDDDGFREELSGYIKSNITKSKIGMPMFGFGMPTPPSLLASQVLRRFNLNKLSRSADLALLKEHTPYFILLLSSPESDTPTGWIRVGQIFESIALMAEREGIRTAPMAAAIQIGENYKNIQNILGTSLRPQMFFRMGYGEDVSHHSPRLHLEDVLEK